MKSKETAVRVDSTTDRGEQCRAMGPGNGMGFNLLVPAVNKRIHHGARNTRLSTGAFHFSSSQLGLV